MAEIGYRLARAREARGLTLEDAERDTRISRRYLEALEDEHFEAIPAPVYARGFLRSYSQYLGMDPQEILALFPRGEDAPRANGSGPLQASMRTPIPATSPSRPTWRQPPRFDSGRPRPEPRGRKRQPPLRGPQQTGEVIIGGVSTPIPDTPKPDPAAPLARPAVAQPAALGTPRLEAPRPGGDTIIGATPGPAPTRRLERAPGEGHRNLIVIIAGVGITLVVIVAAILIATLGGDDGTQTPGTIGSPSGTGTSVTGSPTSTPPAGATTVTGSQPGVVPNLIGESEDDAIELVQEAGLEPRTLRQASQEPEGTVINQSPAPGIQRPAGSEVRIVVSDGP
jgi:transcriptional regulator with XRE-family HTH domain